MGGEVFVNNGPRSGKKHSDLAVVMTVNKPVMTDAQPVQPLQLVAERLGVASGQMGECGLGQATWLRS